MMYGRRIWTKVAALAAGAAGLFAGASYATAQSFPPFTDQCPVSQIEKPCVDSRGNARTCVAAACEDTIDGGDPHSCVECAICSGGLATGGGDFSRCTDTIPCAPGFYCFDYGIEPTTAFGAYGNFIEYKVVTHTSACLEGGAGPQYAAPWSPCDGGGGTIPSTGTSSPGSAPGSNGGGSSGGTTGVVTPGPSWEDGGSDVPQPPAGSLAINGADAGAPPSQQATDVVVLRQGGCDISAGEAASSLPFLLVLPMWLARGRRRRR
jgi:hypothetical protein